MRAGSGNFWRWLRRAGNVGVAGDATDVTSARTALALGSLATKNTVATTDIDNDAVTFAKMQNITTLRLLGRTTAASGDVEEISAGYGLSLATLALALNLKVAVYQEQASAGTNGGTATAGSWFKRNTGWTEVFDTITMSQASGVFAMPAGTFLILGAVPGFACGGFQSRIRNTTDATTPITGGVTSPSTGGIGGWSICFGAVTLAVTKNFELQMQVANTRATDGQGNALSFDLEVYSTLVIVQLA